MQSEGCLSLKVFLAHLFKILMSLKVTEREGDTEKSSIYWFIPLWPLRLRFAQADFGSQELYPGLHCGWQEPK